MTPPIDPQHARQFALKIVSTLRHAGHQAYWAGGCVRDQLLGKQPQDYDVATAAHPEQIRTLFGRHRTLTIGAAFGVVTVLGPPGAGQIEVATFRRDEGYSDGRHPDQVAFSTAEEDARRRDFSINGLFFDPENKEIIDYVSGRNDIQDRVIRCIGNARERFDEDKLRMLRAVRFATTLGFTIESTTFQSMRTYADQIDCVSPERIAAEMRRILVHPHRLTGLNLLRESGLWRIVLPESVLPESVLPAPPSRHQPQQLSTWQPLKNLLEHLSTHDFSTAIAACLWPVAQYSNRTRVAAELSQRWRLSNDEHKRIDWLLAHESELRRAPQIPWPQLQRILIHPWIDHLVELSRAIAQTQAGEQTAIDYAAQKLQLAPNELNPAPLINGNDLLAAGIPRGPQYSLILQAVRDAQLNSQISTQDVAIEYAKQYWNESRDESALDNN
ncbi:MAG: CCA tRNA nucleotidyltransferase [Pirellulaceae bacterium]|nr:CCA tRNA nucleotidyltransferase [Pirellulaceae bacterium]